MPEHQNDFPRLSDNQAKKLRALQQKKFRDLEGTFLAEGLRLCEEAVAASVNVVQAVITTEALKQPRVITLAQKLKSNNVPISLSSQRLFNSISDEKSPQGVICSVRKSKSISINNISSRLILACENLQDPGNLGTIMRSAEWFGVQDILLSSGCVDPYNTKVVRGSMGALFRLNIFEQLDLPHTLSDLKVKKYRVLGTVLNAATLLKDIHPGKDVLLIGNEANGLSSAATDLIDMPITIPGAGNGESLNAAIAASICLYHFSQA